MPKIEHAGNQGRRRRPFISAIILAAGESKRMGRPKQLLPVGRATMLETSVEIYLRSRVNEIIVVLGAEAEKCRGLFKDRRLKTVVNTSYPEGIAGSIKAGIKSVSNESQAFLIALGDEPFIESRIIEQLIRALVSSDKGIIVPVYNHQRGHPVIFRRSYEPELLSLAGDVGARGIVKLHGNDVLEVSVSSDSVINDIDTPGDLKKAQSICGPKGNTRRE